MTHPMIIQGGMGVAISDWKLARAVSLTGQLGVVSGTGVSRIMAARLMEGDSGGHVRRALAAFPYPKNAQKILDEYYIEGGKPAHQPYKNILPYNLKPPRSLDALTVIANFVEVWLAKEGHQGLVGINLLEKVQLPNMASLYGAMLAGVDYVLMGAGIPIQIPGILDKLAEHQAVSYRVDIVGAGPEDDIRLSFNPEQIFPEIGQRVGTLKRPNFLPIISSVVLAKALLQRSEGSIQGFVIEGPTAGGHNAPPRGPLKLNELGEPIYSDKDAVDLAKMREIGLPFWLAGSYGSPTQLQEALAQGAVGIQVGTAFAYCDESGMADDLKSAVLKQVIENRVQVLTDAAASPTGFPFKVVALPGTLTNPSIYAERERICDIGFLRTFYKRDDGKIGFRCPAEPQDDYVRKGGAIEETENRVCLCNALGAAAGFPQKREDGYTEPALITSGNDLVNLGQFIPPNESHYSAQDAIRHLTQFVAQNQ